MISFCVDACLIGTEKHLVCNENGFSWHTIVPNETWHLSGYIKPQNDWCLDTLARLGGAELDLLPPKKYVDAMMTVLSGSSSTKIPWQHAVPSRVHKTFIQNIVKQVGEVLPALPFDYYRNTWVPGNGIIKALKPTKVNVKRFIELVDANVGNVRVVSTFAPGFSGMAADVIYDRLATLTGRLTVSSGPSILTLKREYRDLIEPAAQGCIFSVDFAALEARVLLYEAGRRCDEADLYGMIARELGYDRKAVKGAVICELYGSSKHALGKALNISGDELNGFVRKVKAYFNTKELLGRIKSQFFKVGKITNRYGRPIVIDEPLDHIFINYYAQSSGVDVSLLGFSKLAEQLATSAPGVRPLFLLHDALIIDVPIQHIKTVSDITSVSVPGYVQTFPVKVERLSCTP